MSDEQRIRCRSHVSRSKQIGVTASYEYHANRSAANGTCQTASVLQRAARYFYLALGILCVGLGVIGAFLPVMPTTVFFIVALWAFSLSSHRLESWLLEHRRFGPPLVAWREHRAIPLPVKLTAWISMLASLGIMLLARAPWWALASAAALMAVGAIYIARCPSHPKATREELTGSRPG